MAQNCTWEAERGPLWSTGGHIWPLRSQMPHQRGAFGPVWGQRRPFEACKWSIQDQMGLQRPQKEPKELHRAPRLGPLESYGDEQLSLFLMFCGILFCFILTFSFITFSILTQNWRSCTFSNRERNGHEENIWYFYFSCLESPAIWQNKVLRVLWDTLYINTIYQYKYHISI